ncbi:hypothetical protein Poli38472_014151 [Pythium oligandrum]|uniref:Uncharacterized protein n=1 Tax=Pythium oligandrum TaxID=41045 RepID=A0A8K1FKC1_PYTOL|nr:hypothetical protein Poli38472_014151 [Pythium oligandrum]|eukprot:TMW64034.1 hypothetical protein Poli38472_014151 [Pythium oligandrum]
MSYRGGGGGRGFGGRSRGRGGARGGRGGGGRGAYGGGGGGGGAQLGSETCRRHIEGKCEFEQQNGRPCRYPHFVKKIGEVRGHNAIVKDVVMWAARQQLFTCAGDATIKLWDCASWQELTTLNVHANPPMGREKDRGEGVSAMVLEGSFLFVGFEGQLPYNTAVPVGMIRGWNLDNPAQTFEFHVSEQMPFAHGMPVQSLAVATDPTGNATLFSGSTDGTIRYWQLDATTNQFKCRGTLDGHVRSVTRLKTFVMGTAPILASASVDSTIRLWDLTTFQCVKVLSKEENGHTEAVMDLEFWVNQGETFLISGGLDSEIIVWSMAPPFQQLFKETQDSPVTALCGTQDVTQAPILLIGTADGAITVKELPSFAYKTTFVARANFGHQDTVRRIATGPHNTFFSVGNDRRMLAWQVTGDANSVQPK